MGPTLRAMRAYRLRDSSERIRALRHEAELNPESYGKWLLPVALWEEDNLEEAYRLAEPFLEESPESFDLLVICLAYHLQSGDARQIDHYARRLAVVRPTTKLLRAGTTVVNILLFPLRLFGYRRRSHKYADVLDAWAQWARDYVRTHPETENGA